MQEITEGSYAVEAISASESTPVLVDFWAPWCAPCKVLKADLQELEPELSSQVKMVALNLDEAPAIANELGIRGLPFLAVLSEGRIIGTHTGAMAKTALKSWINDLVAS